MRTILSMFILLGAFACTGVETVDNTTDMPTASQYLQGFSLLGDSLTSPPPGEKLRERYEARKATFLDDPNQVDNIIWHGRFTAYVGHYREAIQYIRTESKNSRMILACTGTGVTVT